MLNLAGDLLRHISKLADAKKEIIVAATRAAGAVLLSFSLSGCWSTGLSGIESTDRKLTTNAVQTNYQAPPDSASDDTTVRNAVSSADLSKPDSQSIPWANTSTGSAGVISSITEENTGAYVCRTFMTTRHSYKGISNFVGKACLVGSGDWQLMSFKEIG